MGRVTATFEDQSHAESAVSDLRRLGVRDTDLSFIARGDEAHAGVGSERDTAGERMGKGAAAGAGAGLLFGLAALAIPGVGPFITAGGLASALGATGATLASGALVGGTSGAIAGALSKAGYSREESEWYGPAIERGAVLVAVDAGGGVSEDQVRTVLRQHGGRIYGSH